MGFISWLKKTAHSISSSVGKFLSGAKKDISSLASTIGKDISGAASDVKSAAKTAASDIKSAATTAYTDAKSAATTIYGDAKSAASKTFDTVTGMGKQVEQDTIGQHGLISNTESNIKSIVTIPLILIAVGIIFVGYNSKTNANISYSR